MSMMRLSKSQRSAKVSVCVPTRDMVHAAFAFDLARMLHHCAIMNIDVSPHFCMGTLIVNQREQLIEMADQAGSTHILWLDSDMMFPPDTLSKLLAHDQPMVAANYVTRQYPHKTVAYKHLGDWRSYVMHDGPISDELIEVEAIGMGCMLVNMDVIYPMTKPRFQTVWMESSGDHMGEDFYFCQQARQAGHKILVDDELSRQISHLGTIAFTQGMAMSGLE